MDEEVGSGVELICASIVVTEIVDNELEGPIEELDISGVLELVAIDWKEELSEEIALEVDWTRVEETSDELIGTDEMVLESSAEDEVITTEIDAASVEAELLEIAEDGSLELADEKECAVLECISEDKTCEELVTSP